MRRYETILISNPDISEEERGALFQKIKELIAQYQGTLITFDEWGTQKLAYPIRKKQRGFYIRADYCGTGTLVAELERLARIDERVLKYITVLLQDNIKDAESLKAEVIAKSNPVETQPAAGAGATLNTDSGDDEKTEPAETGTDKGEE